MVDIITYYWELLTPVQKLVFSSLNRSNKSQNITDNKSKNNKKPLGKRKVNELETSGEPKRITLETFIPLPRIPPLNPNRNGIICYRYRKPGYKIPEYRSKPRAENNKNIPKV
jgi:hypothetical protein